MAGINLKTASEHAKFECIERQYHKKVTPDEKQQPKISHDRAVHK